MQKHNKEKGPALVGVELRSKKDYDVLVANLYCFSRSYTELNKDHDLFGYLF